jgi:predicted nucleotidyltransferase
MAFFCGTLRGTISILYLLVLVVLLLYSFKYIKPKLMKKNLPNSIQNIKPIVLELKSELKKLYGDNMVQLILFGSYARGDASQESDIDLLLVLKSMKSSYYENVFINDLISDFSLNNEKYFSVLAASLEKFKLMKNPLFKRIDAEGIIL